MDPNFEAGLTAKMASLLAAGESPPPLSAGRGAAITALFRLWDTDDSGAVDLDELEAVLRQEAFDDEEAREEAATTLQHLDIDGDGAISLEEVLLFFARSPLNERSDEVFYEVFDLSLTLAYRSSPHPDRHAKIAGYPVRETLESRQQTRGDEAF